jgi:hypothetical protein
MGRTRVAGLARDHAMRYMLTGDDWSAEASYGMGIAQRTAATPESALDARQGGRQRGRRKTLTIRSRPALHRVLTDLEPMLDRADPETFSRLFLYHGPDGSPPSRIGYYVGALLAERLAKPRSMTELAHLQGPEVRSQVAVALAALKRSAR